MFEKIKAGLEEAIEHVKHGVSPIQWKEGDTAVDFSGFPLGTVVRVNGNGWPVVRIMQGVEEVSYTCTPRRD